MKATGIVRRIDDLGRVVIPKELRKTMGINDGDPMEIFVDSDRIILRKYDAGINGCIFCGEMNGLAVIHGKQVCGNCRGEIVEFQKLHGRVAK